METGMLSKRAGKSKTGFQVSLFSVSENDFLINFPGEDRGECCYVNMCIYSTPSSFSREERRGNGSSGSSPDQA